MKKDETHTLLCHRCGADLRPGEGNFYLVKIEAFADPTPPEIDPDDLSVDVLSELSKAIEEARSLSEMELREQVHTRLTIHLCGRCYRRWIENPAG